MSVSSTLNALSQSQTVDVRMPDGTIMRNVPRGARKADIERAWQKARTKGAVPDKRDTSFLQGAREEIGNAAANAGWLMETLNGRGVAKALTGLPMASDITRAQVQNQAVNAPYRGSTAGHIVGGILATLPTAMIPGGALAQGAAAGALLTKDPNDTGGLLKDAAIGGVAGKAGEQVGKRIIAPVAERLGRTAPARAVSRAISRATGVPQLPNPQITRPERTITRITPDLAPVRQNIDDAARLGLPYSLADASPELRSLAGSVSRKSTAANALAERTFAPRAQDQGVRAMQAIDDYLARPVDVKANSQAIMRAANKKSQPFYDKAYEGGSMAPLEKQFGDAFQESSKAVAAAKAELAAAQRELTLSKAGINRAGNNVYMNAKALPADRSAQAAVATAERKLAQATAGHANILEKLRIAQTDASSNAPGAVWSPRIQQFLDDPVAKSGLARGLEVQRLEALAAGKPFNPTEYAITGMDEAGNPIVGNVPNMRTLDAVKRGLDEIINDYPKDVTGKAVLDQRGRAVDQVRKSLLKELDDINPDYSAARAKYQGFAKSRDALDRGYKSTGRTVFDRDIARASESYGPKEMGQFRSGYASGLRDQVSNATDRTNPYQFLWGGNERRAKLGTVFPEGAPIIGRQAELESDMAKTAWETLGGSPTQRRAMADQLFDTNIADYGKSALEAVANPKFAALRAVGRGISDRLATRGEQNAAALAPRLFDTTNPRGILDFLDEMAKKQAEEELRKRAYAQSFGLLGFPVAAAGIAGSQ